MLKRLVELCRFEHTCTIFFALVFKGALAVADLMQLHQIHEKGGFLLNASILPNKERNESDLQRYFQQNSYSSFKDHLNNT